MKNLNTINIILLVLDVYYCISVNIPFFHLLEIRYFIELYNKIEEFIIYN